MTEKDLFNAINEIDTKHIVNAWKNTENEPLAIESGKTSKLKIFGIAAAFAAAVAAVCLVVYIRVNSPDSRTLIQHSPSDILPSDVHGPDGVRITYGDVTEVTDEYGKEFAADEITEDNWQKITCDGFTYLSMPFNGENYNSIDNPSMFDGTGMVLRLDDLSYTRWNVGDTLHGLTVKSASTVFQYHYKGTPTFTPKECSVEFDGTAPVDGYIMYNDNGELVCVPKSGESFLPVIYPCEDLKFGHEGQYGGFKFNVVLPAFYLENDRAFEIDSILGDKGYAEVSLTISNVRMCSMASMKSPNFIRAAIDSISEYVPGEKLTGELPFELRGPDGTQIRFEDIGHINFADALPVVTGTSLTEDNWESVYCYDFGYIAQPTGKNFNSLDNPELFDSERNYIGEVDTFDIGSIYKRINVGEKFGGLTLRDATTVFANDSKRGRILHSCLLEFDGSININAYIIREPQTKNVYCIPLNGETKLPLLVPSATTNMGERITPWFRGRHLNEHIGYCTELPAVVLNVDNIDIDDYLTRDEPGLVNLTLDNIKAVFSEDGEYAAAISASVAGIDGELAFGLVGADGKSLRTEDISLALDRDGNFISPNRLTADNWDMITCDFAYLAESEDGEFKRYRVGDTVCGLTVTSAQTTFIDRSSGNSMPHMLIDADFEGVLEMDTYIAKYGESVYCLDTGLPISSFDQEKLTAEGKFVPKRPQPEFNTEIGFIPDGSDYTPYIFVGHPMVEDLVERLYNGEVIPVHISVSDISTGRSPNDTKVFRVTER